MLLTNVLLLMPRFVVRVSVQSILSIEEKPEEVFQNLLKGYKQL